MSETSSMRVRCTLAVWRSSVFSAALLKRNMTVSFVEK
jgi:hypothetical protein